MYFSGGTVIQRCQKVSISSSQQGVNHTISDHSFHGQILCKVIKKRPALRLLYQLFILV